MHDLKRLRLAANLTLEQASEGICSVSYLSLIEQGKRIPSEKILGDLTERFVNLGVGITTSQLSFYRDLEGQILRQPERGIESLSTIGEDNEIANYLRGLSLELTGNNNEAISEYRKSMPNRFSREFGLKAGIALVRTLKRASQMPEAALTFEVVHLTYKPELAEHPALHAELDSNGVWPLMEVGSSGRALTIAQEAWICAADGSVESKIFAAWTLADQAAQAQNYEEASRWLGVAREAAALKKHDSAVLMLDMQLASLQLENGQISAADVLVKSDSWRKSLENRDIKHLENEYLALVALAYGKLGKVAELDATAAAYLTWRQVFTDVPDLAGIEAFAKAYFEVGNIAEVTKFLEIATANANQIGPSMISAKFWMTVAGLFEQIGDTASAYDCLKKMAAATRIPSGLHFASVAGFNQPVLN
jgi:transcriptional regulator with XRE-family HTH domain